MRIIFLFPKWTDAVGEIKCCSKKAGVYPPLNLAVLGSIAENKGHTVKIIDGEVNNYSNEEIVEMVKNFEPDLIGLTSTSPFFHIVFNLAKKLKDSLPNIHILLGGPHISVMQEESFLPVFDFGFIGEADMSFSVFLDIYKDGEYNQVDGLIYRKDNKIIVNPSSVKYVDVNKLPVPAYHLLDMDKYYIGTKDGKKHFSVIMTVRGCPFNCIFCSTKVSGKNIRRKKPQLVIDEMKLLIDKYNIEHFIFLDDTLTLDKNHIINICDLIIENNLNISFEGSTRANLIDEEIVKKLKQAGMNRISFGLESVNKNIRINMKKNVPLRDYIKANKLTNAFGIETWNSCMIGLPGETKDTVMETVSFIRDNKEIKQANISIAVPYPGTELYDMAVNKQGGVELMDNNFSNFIRYNSSVLKVGDLSPDDLIRLQNTSFVSIYISPHRWKSVINKSGWRGWLMTWKRLFRCFRWGCWDLIFVSRNYWKKELN